MPMKKALGWSPGDLLAAWIEDPEQVDGQLWKKLKAVLKVQDRTSAANLVRIVSRLIGIVLAEQAAPAAGAPSPADVLYGQPGRKRGETIRGECHVAGRYTAGKAH